jgi:hypothetical protein
MLTVALDASPENGLRLTASEKAARVKEIRAEILAMERQEEAMIEAAAAEGTIIERRVRADPLAVLDVRLVPRPDTADAPKPVRVARNPAIVRGDAPR